MEKLDISKLKRNPEAIKKKLKKVDNTIIAKEDMLIIFPEKFVDKELTNLDNVSDVFGVVAVLDNNNNYSVLTIPSRFTVEPAEIENIEINEEPYVALHIEAGQPLISNTVMVKNQDVTFPIFDLFMLQGKIPWYINYEDLLDVFIKLDKYAGSKVGGLVLALEALTAINARDPKNPETEFRMVINSEEDMRKKPVEWVGLKNIYYSFKSTLSKIAGAYFKQGVIAAIVKPEKETTDLEYVLRK